MASRLDQYLKMAKDLARRHSMFFELEYDPLGEWTAEFCSSMFKVTYEGTSKRRPDTAIKRAIEKLTQDGHVVLMSKGQIVELLDK